MEETKLSEEDLFLINIFNTHIKYNARVKDVMGLKMDDSAYTGERGLPGDKKCQENDWWKTMLLRYGLAMHFSKEKDVLETCSGLGWGAYLLDDVAKSVACIEIDKTTTELSKSLWNTTRTKYVNGSVLNIPFEDSGFDVVTAMESIEHFNLPDIKLYLSEMYRVMMPGGHLIGSSGFFDTKMEAKAHCATNKHHKYICTTDEIKELLEEQGFKNISILLKTLFIATNDK